MPAGLCLSTAHGEPGSAGQRWFCAGDKHPISPDFCRKLQYRSVHPSCTRSQLPIPAAAAERPLGGRLRLKYLPLEEQGGSGDPPAWVCQGAGVSPTAELGADAMSSTASSWKNWGSLAAPLTHPTASDRCLSEVRKAISGCAGVFGASPALCLERLWRHPRHRGLASARISAAVSNRFRDTGKGLVFPNITNLCPEILGVLQSSVSAHK